MAAAMTDDTLNISADVLFIFIDETGIADYSDPKNPNMDAGLEIADLVAHSAGRQRRHQIAGKEGVTKDFEQKYWHGPYHPPSCR